MKKLLWLGLVLCLELICIGCGDTFRPIIIPNPPQFPNPAAANTVISINNNAPCAGINCEPEVTPGSAMVVDVSGDTVVSEQNVGLAPVHAVQQTASVVLVVNQSTQENPQDSLSKETFSSTVINNTTTIALPLSYTTDPLCIPPPPPNQPCTIHPVASGQPNFVATTESAQAYVLIPQYQPDSSGTGTFSITPIIAVVSTSANQVTHTIPVGNSPVAMAETPDQTKLYVANNADNTVDGFNTSDRTQRAMDGTFIAPVWMNARSDSQRLYVLNGNGVISTVDTTSTAGPDNVIDASITVAGANYMLYDGNENRLYVPAGNQLTIIDVSQSIPSVLTTIPAPAFTVPNLGLVLGTAASVASLPDSSRAYLGSYASVPSNLTISSVSGDGTNATYAYTLTSGAALQSGMGVAISGITVGSGNPQNFEGSFQISNVISGTSACPQTCFQVANPNVLGATAETATATGNNIFAQVTEIDAVSLGVATTIAIPSVIPDASVASWGFYVPACANTRDMIGPTGSGFRFTMAAGGDSSRVYFASCDGGSVNIIDTSTESYGLAQEAPLSARPPLGYAPQNPPQNPIFMLAGPP
jgi:DNA-binding beta-propeller fold protein YncE